MSNVKEQTSHPCFLTMEIRGLRNIVFKEVEIKEGKVNFLSGKNGTGKSSIIDAIFLAVFGASYSKKNKGKLYNTNSLINNAGDEISIKIEINAKDRHFKLKRQIVKTSDISANNKELIITSLDNQKITSNDVKEMFNVLSIDLVDFLGRKPLEQLEFLQKLVDQEKLQEIQRQEEVITEQKSFYNKQIRDLNDAIRLAENNKETEDVKVVDITELLDKQKLSSFELEQTNKKFIEIQEQNTNLKYKQIKIETLKDNIKKHNLEIERLKEEIKDCDIEIKLLGEDLKTFEDSQKLEMDFKNQIDELNNKNKSIQIEIEDAHKIQKQQLEKQAKYNNYKNSLDRKETTQNYQLKNDKEIKALRKQRAELFKSAGIELVINYDERNGLIIDDKIFSDLSSGEQIKTIVKIINSTYSDKHLKLCIIRNSSLLDLDAQQTLKEIANKDNITFICEVVSENDEVIVSTN